MTSLYSGKSYNGLAIPFRRRLELHPRHPHRIHVEGHWSQERMLASVIVIIQLVRRNDGAVNLRNLLDFVGGVKEIPQFRNVIRWQVLAHALRSQEGFLSFAHAFIKSTIRSFNLLTPPCDTMSSEAEPNLRGLRERCFLVQQPYLEQLHGCSRCCASTIPVLSKQSFSSRHSNTCVSGSRGARTELGRPILSLQRACTLYKQC